MIRGTILLSRVVILASVLLATIRPVEAASTVQIGPTGKTYASSAVQCAATPNGEQAPMVEAGLFNVMSGMKATVFLNGLSQAMVTADKPTAKVWLNDGNNTVVVRLNKKTADQYAFSVPAGMCALPDTSGNTFSPDGTLEYAASGKSYATVAPGCAFNPGSGQAHPYVNVFANGQYLLNVSINGIPLTQLNGTTRLKTPVFLSAGQNVISLANGYVSVDYFVRDGGNGSCSLP